MNLRRYLTLPLFLCLTSLLWVSVAFAQDAPLLCALNQAMECTPGNSCTQQTVQGVNLPDFIHIDMENKTIKAFGNPDNSQGTTIKTMEKLDGKIILLGAENGRGWTIDMDEKTGKFTAAVAEDRVGFVIFGTCIQR